MSVRDDDRAVRESYERVPYPSGSQPETHPAHLAALAILNGFDPAPPEESRVLELGCADGGNLVPMAIDFPEARFVGIDLAPRQIEAAGAFAQSMSLANIDFRAMSILDVDRSFGEFDTILCHGVFSWVGEAVQEKILDICRENLGPSGVAYISYNIYPGWHHRALVRDAVLFHTRGIDDLHEKTQRAFEFMHFLAESAGEGNDAHSVLLRTGREHFENHSEQPEYVTHEYLEATNAPCYFRDFVARAARHGLRYVADAEPAAGEVDALPANVAAKLREFASNDIDLQQYVDFVTNRSFRRSILMRDDAPRSHAMLPVSRLFASSAAKAQSPDPDLRAAVTESFTTERGKPFSSTHPLAKAALVALAAQWPRAVCFDDLRQDMEARLRSRVDAEALADLLTSLHAFDVVDLRAAPPNCVNRVSDRPRASELGRRQAASGLLVSNQRHRVVKLDDPVARFLVPLLDGTRDRHALLRLLDREAAEQRLDMSLDGKTTVDARRVPAILQAVLDHHLKKMVEYALLVG
jgi:SAM-dependent methyltransferase